MVAKIPTPEIDSIEIIRRLIDERVWYREFYQSIRGDWLSQTEHYLDVAGNPELMEPLDLRNYTSNEEEAKARKTSMINLYSPSEEQFQYALLSALRRDHGLLFCPSCGGAGVPGTLDHYLPKTVFPEFSVLLANLTPMCIDCQEAKGADYLTNDNQRKFLHGYFDDVNSPIYRVTISGDFETPEFSIEYESVPHKYKALVVEHVEGVKLAARFIKYCGTKYLHLLKNVSELREEQNEALLEWMLKKFLRDSENNSINCWEAIFYRGVLASDDLMEYLRSGDLPDDL